MRNNEIYQKAAKDFFAKQERVEHYKIDFCKSTKTRIYFNANVSLEPAESNYELMIYVRKKDLSAGYCNFETGEDITEKILKEFEEAWQDGMEDEDYDYPIK